MAAGTEQGPPIGNIGLKKKKKEERIFSNSEKNKLVNNEEPTLFQKRNLKFQLRKKKTIILILKR